jgi:hypothetical protein
VKRVVIESPVAANDRYTMAQNYRYFQECCADAFLTHKEFPYGSHWIAQGILDDTNPDHRKMGIECGFAWACIADKAVFYTDLGMSRGMTAAKEHWAAFGKLIEERALGPRVIRMIEEMADE